MKRLALCLALIACSTDKETKDEDNSSSSKETMSSSSVFTQVYCEDFVEGTTREHYGKEKAQFCDDRDGKKYVYVRIGSQTWLAENLNFNASGSKCYNDSVAYCDKYGRLYNWETAKVVCPDGWHLPSLEEFTTLRDFAGGVNAEVGRDMKATSGWEDWEDPYTHEIKSGNGIDKYGFTALPSGYYKDESFLHLGTEARWQLSEKILLDHIGWLEGIFYISNNIMKLYDFGDINNKSLYNVRCVKN